MPPTASSRWKRVGVVLLPLLLTAAYLRIQLGRAGDASPSDSAAALAPVSSACVFPGDGPDSRRLVVAIVDSLRDQTALDPGVMPWLAAHRKDALWGHMRPCLSQLSLLCFRTMFEGSEPLLVSAFDNFSGMRVTAPSLIHRLAGRGVRIAAVADQGFIKLYQPSLAEHFLFEERSPASLGRDAFSHEKTFEFLSKPALSVIVSHTIDTDATAHRVGIGAPDYVAKFRETDDFLRELSARLHPTDSLVILGDHGHDPHGYHSTGIPSETAYFASGPWFPRGVQLDLDMASTYFLMGAVTCEATPSRYTGQQPFDALAWPPEVRDAVRRATPPPSTGPGEAGGSLGLDVAAFMLGIVLLVLLVRVTDGAPTRRSWVLVTTALVAGLAGGLLSPWVLVTLQNHVNPQWTLAFWGGLAAVIVVLGLTARRWLGLSAGLSVGFTAWGLILYALWLGPYYYGAIRMLLFGTAWLGAAFVARAPPSERRALFPWFALALLPTVPILFPVMKEWQPSWVLLQFVEGRGAWAPAATALVVLGVAFAVRPDGDAWKRPAVALLGLLAVGASTDLGNTTLVAAALVLVAYAAWIRIAERLAERDDGARILVPIGQASYALVMLFVLLGGYRFAAVDFRFALALTPVEAGEARAAAIAVPLCVVKYLAPVGLLLWLGPAVDGRASTLVLLKLLVLGAGLLGMELLDAPRLVLFKQLQGQELAITVLVYAAVGIGYLVRPGAGVDGSLQ